MCLLRITIHNKHVHFSHQRQPSSYIPSGQTQLLLLDPRYHACEYNDSSQDHSPQVDMQHALVVVCLRRRRHGGKCDYEDNVARHAMVLVDLLCVVHSTVYLRHEVLRKPNRSLDNGEYVRDETQDGVRRLEVHAIVLDFVDLDYGQTGNHQGKAGANKRGMCVGTIALLLRSVCRLED